MAVLASTAAPERTEHRDVDSRQASNASGTDKLQGGRQRRSLFGNAARPVCGTPAHSELTKPGKSDVNLVRRGPPVVLSTPLCLTAPRRASPRRRAI